MTQWPVRATVTPYYDSGQVKLLQGDVRERLREMEAESVQCVVTSPPYWSLRDYGVPPSVWGGDEFHLHEWVSGPVKESFTGKARWQHVVNGDGESGFPSSDRGQEAWDHNRTRENSPGAWGEVRQGETCHGCGAWRGALGLEPTPELFVAHTVDVFREVKRVLAKDGTLWLNIGDSYSGGRRGIAGDDETPSRRRDDVPIPRADYAVPGLKAKDLVGIPWMLAFALRADGWWLRQDIIWHKPNPMPESVPDRCTKAHEYLFLLSKSKRYYYDQDAIREEGAGRLDRGNMVLPQRLDHPGGWQNERAEEWNGRNKRSVWIIPTSPLPEAHFATFPPALVEPCILAGCPEGGTVLDPFVGSGTTAMVARDLGRRAVGIDLNPEYLDIAVRRIGAQMSLEVAR